MTRLPRRQFIQTGVAGGFTATGVGPVAAQTGSVAEHWQIEASSLETPPVVVGDTVYVVSTPGVVSAFAAATGAEQWREDTDINGEHPPVVQNGRVYVGGDDRVAAVSDGSTVWETGMESEVWRPLTVSDRAVLVGGEWGLYALDPETGDQQWRFMTEDSVDAKPVVASGSVYVISSGTLHAVDVVSGTEQWRFDGKVNTRPTVTDGMVYVGVDFLTDRTVVALDAADGTRQWSHDTGWSIFWPLTVAAGTVYAVQDALAEDPNVYAFDAASGRRKWTFNTGTDAARPATVADGTVYVANGGDDGASDTLYAIAASDGTERWQFDIPTRVAARPMVRDETVYVTARPDGADGSSATGQATSTVHALATTDGRQQWTARLEGVVLPAVSVRTGTAYVGTMDGTVTAVGGTVSPQPSGASATNTPSAAPSSGLEFGSITSDPVPGGVAGVIVAAGAIAYYLSGHGDSDSDESPATDIPDPEASVETGASSTGAGARTANHDEGPPDSSPESRSFDEAQGHAAGAPATIPSPPAHTLDYDELDTGEVIGTGGNADIYHTKLDGDTPVELAIKEPRVNETVHTDQVERLLDEARTWASLDDHDHIVDVVDYGSRPTPWIAMEYMDGDHLGARADEFTLAQALWTALAVVRGVRHAHRQGVAHLDLKPQNILFRRVDGAWDVPKVADWGLSKHLLDHSNSVEGLSPQYAAPEQFDDDYGVADEVTDIYQLGAVFYELFTGRPPFEGETAKVMHRTLTDDPIPPSELTPALPAELDDVLLNALTKDKADRYESVLYLRDALADVAESASGRTFTLRTSGEAGTTGGGTTTDGSSQHPQSAAERTTSGDTEITYADISVGNTLSKRDAATVSAARIETRTGRENVALKELQFDETVHTDLLETFASAAETWAKLDDHPGIVTVYGWGTQPAPWLVLEYMDRGDLGSLVDQLTPRQSVVAAGRIAEAIHHAHTRGTAHLSLKPSNVLFRSAGDDVAIQVSDWGIGKLTLTHTRQTTDLNLAYAAPEQFDDDHGQPGQHSDVYALGALCYELFTGKPPFEGPPAEVMTATLDGAFPLPTALDPTLPSTLDDVVRTAMATDPADRYESVLYLRDDIQSLSDG